MRRWRRQLRKLPPKERYWEVLYTLLPCTRWLRTYGQHFGGTLPRFRRDFLAGCAVTCLIVPQGLSYAQVAGLPPQYGLCARPMLQAAAHIIAAAAAAAACTPG